MDPQRWQRVQQLFEHAVPLDHDARVRFLAAECGDDPGLEGEVLALLRAHDRDSQIERRIEDDIGSTLYEPDLAVGQIIERFKVTQLLGRGGMGSVYLAERADQQFRQKVALKIVSRGLVHGELLVRFRAERQILARLNHPNIARLMDGGQMSDGTPFIVMEYVEGLRIDRYCDQHQLSTHARLRLVQQVCAAVNYAHQHLIIHRDLKPANILVTRDGVPKLLDFGIAKLLDAEERADTESPVTHVRECALTPEHASPEQLRGELVGTASDVYGLGVLIYELLTGRHPYRFANRSLYDIERAIREQGPLAPSAGVQADARSADSPQLRALARELAGDLDNIVLKAMDHQPERRYASAAALAQDIQNYLERRPVLARPDTWAYRTRKFVRRNTFAVASAASVTVLMVALGVFSTLRIAAERDTAERERQTANRVSQFMINAFRLANPSELSGKQVTAQEVLDAAEKHVDEQLADDPGVRLASMRTIAETYIGMGLIERARTLLIKTVAQTRAEPRASRLDLARALHLLGTASFYEYHEQAERAYDESLSIRASISQEKTDEGILLLTNIAELRLMDRRVKEAFQALDRAEKLADARSPPDTKSLGQVYYIYGEAYLVTGDFAKAEDYARRALPLLKGVVSDGNEQYGSVLATLGDALFRQWRTAEAEQVYHELLDRQLERYGPDHALVGQAWNGYALVLTAEGKYQEAEKAFTESLRIAQQASNPNHLAITICYMNLGEVHRLAGESDKALQNLDTSLDLWRQTEGSFWAARIAALLRKSATLRDLGRLQMAQATFDEAQTLANEKLEPADPYFGQVLAERGTLRLARGELDGAQQDLQEARNLLAKSGTENSVADASIYLGEAALRGDHLDQARIEFSAALATRRRIFPEGHWAIVDAQSRLGHVLYLSGDRAQGLPMMSQALKDLRAIRPAGDVITQAAEGRLHNATNLNAATSPDPR